MSQKDGRFKRRLSLIDLSLLGIGSMIGSGWLFGALNGAKDAGNLAWIAWLFGAVVVVLIGLVYGELGAMLPRAGGFVRYPQYTHGSLVGWFIGFASMLAYSSVAGVETDAFRQYAAGWWSGLGTADSPTALGILVQVALLVIFLLINYWSVNFFGKVNTVVTLFKFIVPVIIIVILFTHMHVSNFSQGGASPGGIKGIETAVTGAGIVFAYLGFRQSVDFGAEAAKPQRDIPWAIIIAMIVSTVLYLLLQFGFIGAVPEAIAKGGWANVTFDQPYADIAKGLGMMWLSGLVFTDAVISPSGTGNVYMSGTARTIFAWAKNGVFYSIFGKVNPRTGIPRGAMWLTLLLSIAWIMPLKFQLWSVLINAVTSATVMTYMVGPVSIASLRKTSPDMHRPFRLRGMSVISLLAFIGSSWIIYWSGWSTDSLLIGLVIGSLVLYFAFMDRAESHAQLKAQWKSGIWLIVYYIFIFVMSRLGSFGPSGTKPVIPNPWDSLIVAVGAIILYFWGIASRLPQPEFDEDESEDVSVGSSV